MADALRADRKSTQPRGARRRPWWVCTSCACPSASVEVVLHWVPSWLLGRLLGGTEQAGDFFLYWFDVVQSLRSLRREARGTQKKIKQVRWSLGRVFAKKWRLRL